MKAASELIGVAPSGLSDSVRILEARIGAPLLVRHKHGVSPTSEGERVYAAAGGIVDLLNQAIGPDDPKTLSGPCRLSLPGEVANTCIGAALKALEQDQPGLQISVFVEDEVVDHGRFGRDYFLRLSSKPTAPDGLRRIWSGSVHAILVASAAQVGAQSAEDVDDLSGRPFIGRVGAKWPVTFALRNPAGSIAFERGLQVSQAATRLALAAEGLGVTACLDVCAAPALQAGLVRQVLAGRFSVPVTAQLLTLHHRPRRLDMPVLAAIRTALTRESVATEDDREA